MANANTLPTPWMVVYLVSDGCMYTHLNYACVDVDDLLKMACQCLQLGTKEQTFDILFKTCLDSNKVDVQTCNFALPMWWTRDDIVIPFGDSRAGESKASDPIISCVIIFHVDHDTFTLVTERDYQLNRRRVAPMELMRQRDIKASEMNIIKIAPPQKLEFTLIRSYMITHFLTDSTRQPSSSSTRRRSVFMTRILQDFGYQWRHVCRNQYNQFTFRKLAHAILRFLLCDFTVSPVLLHKRRRGVALVRITDAPCWEHPGPVWDYQCPPNRPGKQSEYSWGPFPIYRFGETLSFLVNPNFYQGFTRITFELDDFRQKCYKPLQDKHVTVQLQLPEITYVLLSMRHVSRFTFWSSGEAATRAYPTYNEMRMDVEPLCDPKGNGFSCQAIDLLVEGSSPPHRRSKVHNLPVELQDIILKYAGLAHGPVETARIGCVLSMGTPFNWFCEPDQLLHRKDFNGVMYIPDLTRPRTKIERRDDLGNARDEEFPAEILYFGQDFTGLAYA